jgi:hypothetical protein
MSAPVLEAVGRFAAAQLDGDHERLDRLLSDDFLLVGPLGFMLGDLPPAELEHHADVARRAARGSALSRGGQCREADHGAECSTVPLRASVVSQRVRPRKHPTT